MRNMFKRGPGGFRPNNIMLFPSRHEHEEYGRGKRGNGMCDWCGARYDKKSWHHPEKTPQSVAWSGQCPACRMIANGTYEGQVTIRGIPHERSTALSDVIRSFLRKAYRRDCQHRLIALHHETEATWTVTVTENQLAARLARAITQAFKGATAKITHSRQPDDVERVEVCLPPLTATEASGSWIRSVRERLFAITPACGTHAAPIG